ncbi:hypothetical protein [Nisaea sediminum]|uniref:hypothetical protein n=1 Tax=Nisaea sediminum TaxID=2775867 RepID=UPI0018676339|nr:hypothetical protein [Nisaea sediminum]
MRVRFGWLALLICLAVIVTALPHRKVEAQQVRWVPCANEGQSCTFDTVDSPTDIVTVRFGQANHYVFLVMTGAVGSINCERGLFGDPYPGQAKSCSYTTDSLFPDMNYQQLTTGATIWEGEASNQSFSGATRWVAFGIGQKWFFALAHGNPQSIRCSINDGIGGNFDPAPGERKQCKLTMVGYSGASYDPPCATEGQSCTQQAEGLYIVRFGADTQWIYRIINAPAFACSDAGNGFNFDPAPGKAKTCGEYALSTSTARTSGDWTLVSSCEGSSLAPCTVSEELQVGWSSTNTHMEQSSIANTVTVSITKKGIGGVTGTLQDAVTYTQSEGYTSALNQSVTRSQTETCGPTESGQNVSMQMWQFETTTTVPTCSADGVCSITVSTTDVQCVTNPPTGYNGPQCLPGMCSPTDPTCTVCRSN